jgi:protein O-GlcNAc transferase
METNEIKGNVKKRGLRIAYEACPLCNNVEVQPWHTANVTRHEMWQEPLPSYLTWVRCRNCGHIFTEDYWSQEALDIMFKRTHANQRPGNQYEQARVVSARMIEKVQLSLKEGRWLDVGFGNGALMMTADEYGYEVVGTDLRESSVKAMDDLGFEAYNIPIENMNGLYDIVSMCDVLEHIPYPKDALAAVARMTHKGSILLISMPNTECALWDMWGDNNPYWIEIEHYHNFSKTNLYALLRSAGFIPIRYSISERYRACMEVTAWRDT